MSAQQLVASVGAFTSATKDAINANFSALFGGLLQVGNVYYCQPTTTVASTQQDGSSARPFSTLLAAYNACVAGRNDTVVLVGNGATSGTARVDVAFTWAKNATHLIGICSPVLLSQRARIAPTAATAAFTPFFTISAIGCAFQNLQWFHGFTTGTTAQICMVVTGERNYFKNCHVAGMGDAASAVDAGSRTIVLGGAGAGENYFEDCTFGVDTGTKRTGANATVEFTGGAVRNIFRRCTFPFWCSAGSPLGILGTGNNCVDRFNNFEYCTFINATKSTGTAMTVLGSFTTASPGGMILFRKCATVGITILGDTNFLANSFIDAAAPSNTAGQEMVPAA